MELFSKLIFKPHPVIKEGTIATHWFDNEYGVSVITGGYGSRYAPYELAVMDEDGLCYNTVITNDVVGYRTAREIDELMTQVEAL